MFNIAQNSIRLDYNYGIYKGWDASLQLFNAILGNKCVFGKYAKTNETLLKWHILIMNIVYCFIKITR